MSQSDKNPQDKQTLDSAEVGESLNDCSNASSSSSDFETSRFSKLRRKSFCTTSFHYPALPMRVVGANSSPSIPSTARDVTLNPLQILEDSSDSELHISDESSNDEPGNKSITFSGRGLLKKDLDFIRKENKRKPKPNKTLYKD